MLGFPSKSLRLWHQATSSFWFVPGLIIASAIGLAVLLVEVDTWVAAEALSSWPRLFGAGRDGSRALLTAVAGSMITVAGVVFSITLVALSLTSSQYSSRVLRNFMRNRVNQAVLGVFVGIFAYCLIVLRTIRDAQDDGAFVPAIAVFVGLALGLVGVVVLVFFIHHISASIEASRILSTAFEETMAAARRSMPDEGDGAEDDEGGPAPTGPGHALVRAGATGYLQAVDVEALAELAAEHATVVWVAPKIGDFITEGVPLVSMSGTAPSEEDAQRLRHAFTISRSRTLLQDVPFGIRQLVDVALKGLSPGINDTTTAVMAIDYLTALLRFIAPRPVRSRIRAEDGELRVVLWVSTFPALVSVAFDQIRQNAGGNCAVLARLVWSVGVLSEVAATPRRRKAILDVTRGVEWSIRETIPNPADRAELLRQVEEIVQRLGGTS